jgi:hypothetical protein
VKQRDRENLEFLLNLSPEDFDQWYAQASDDDIEYAADLITLKELELQDQQVLSTADCVDAQKILLQFTKG